MNKKVIMAAGVAALMLSLGACASSCQEGTAEPQTPIVVEFEDCDAEDLRNREPDCAHILKPTTKAPSKPLQTARQPAPARTTKK